MDKNLINELKNISYNNEKWLMFKLGVHKTYYVSDKGRIISVFPVNYKRRHKHYSIRFIKPFLNHNRYEVVRIVDNKITKWYTVHRIVLSTFCPNTDMHNLQVNHIDGNKSNNNLDNLEWCTGSENMIHAVKIGLVKSMKEVSMYSLSGEYIKTFHSLSDAEKETGIKVTNIIANCKGKVRQSGNYQWRYDKKDKIESVRLKRTASNLKIRGCKQIVAIQNGIQIKKFNSVLEAGRFVGKPHASVNISACALGKRKTAYGYNWQYI